MFAPFQGCSHGYGTWGRGGEGEGKRKEGRWLEGRGKRWREGKIENEKGEGVWKR